MKYGYTGIKLQLLGEKPNAARTAKSRALLLEIIFGLYFAVCFLPVDSCCDELFYFHEESRGERR